MIQKQTSHSSFSNKSHTGFYYGKNRDQGSIFSNEIALLAACVPSYYPQGSLKKIENTKKTLQASPLESQRVNKSIFLKNYFAAS